MKNRWKRLLSMLLAMAMCLSLLAFTASAETTSGTCGDNLTWRLNGGVLTISGTGYMEYYFDMAEAPWDSQRAAITSVMIENGVTGIGANAFADCPRLTSVTIPSSVTRIYIYAFADCTSLTSITLPDSLDSIAVGTFYDCTSLTSIIIPDSVTSIVHSAFSGCSNLTDVYYGGSEENWSNITIGEANECLTNAAIHFNSSITQLFNDTLNNSAYYFNPVYWAVQNNITSGTGNNMFSPEDGCTRAQVVTFLWRAAGCPEPSTTVSPFTDVQDSTAYYYKAVLWAVEKGITTGATETTFDPESTCNRAQIVTFLWRYENKPAPTSTVNPFADVPSGEYYYNAVLWAAENKITTGTDDTHFSPDDPCLRAQIVTFLYRDMAK